jgi:NAD(P) transhydrogenase subunit beta
MPTLTFDRDLIIGLAYLISAALFIFGLKLMSSPATARRGNYLASVAMLIAILATLWEQEVVSYGTILAGVVIGAAIGVASARMVKMTAMPQMVAVFNGLGGASSGLIAAAEFIRLTDAGAEMPLQTSVTIMLSLLIGMVTFSGSMIAFAKLQEMVSTRAVTYPLQNPLNALLFLAIVGISVYLVVAAPSLPLFLVLTALCLLLGVLIVIPIGGADMPVVISLLNSYSGLAGAAAGFVLNNTILIIGGALVGAAGLILTQIMTKAMHRSLFNVMFGAFGAQAGGAGRVAAVGADGQQRFAKDGTAEDLGVMLAYARSVIIVPGYGLAVAQAQHQVRELASLLEKRGVDVKYAIHPVAGRMPGHMNVLLAEADVPYDKLFDLDDINDDFDKTDVALVVGANDVTNPAARDVPESPIYGMPILNVDRAHQVIVLKRSMSPGFAGIDNDLFYKDNTTMLFGDAKQSLTRLVDAVSES